VASDASAKPKKSSHRKADAEAQPVQDFDIPASNFASCPVPEPSPENDPSAAAVATTPEADETSAPVAQLVSPEELAADAAAKAASTEAAPKPIRTAAVTPAVLPVAPVKKPSAPVAPVPDGLAANPYNFNHSDNAPDQSAAMASAPSNFASSSSKQENRGYEPASSPASNGEWNDRLMQQARWLGDMGLTYDEDWRPPGESRAWTMDCSNTTRYLYKVTAGINLPRTASDQYYFLHLQGKAWDVPQASNGYADCNYLRSNLKVGDLLFWENTYRPERQPPITHVMIFLGTNERGEWIMVGSQSSRGGLHNRRHGGPDIYVFDPTQPCGGYTTWFGFVHHQGRFCAYGRPLEADPSKLTVATND
jgi:cell wall-associated NlpC family hydrolase